MTLRHSEPQFCLKFFIFLSLLLVVTIISLSGPLSGRFLGPFDPEPLDPTSASVLHPMSQGSDEVPSHPETQGDDNLETDGGPLAADLDPASGEHSRSLERRLSWQEQHFLEAGWGPFRGTLNFTKKFLTIGVLTVYRKEEYFKRALKSLIDQSWPEEREMATIVIFLADSDLELRNKSLKIVEDNFQPYLDSGFIQVITASPAIYPTLDESLRRTYDHPLQRVIWRTKQLVDAAFLFSYVSQHNMSEYHVIVEDDNEASNQYITAIRDFVTLKASDGSLWGALQFAGFICIGLTLRTPDLGKLTEFLLLFYQEMPYDLLTLVFIDTEYPWEDRGNMVHHRDPASFQHFGLSSTLSTRVQDAVDGSFGKGKRRFEAIRNPPALRISTTLKTQDNYVAANAYSPAPGWFKGISQGESDTYDIVYAAAMGLERVIVLTGSLAGENKMDKGELLIGSGVDDPASNFCPKMTRVGGFSNGDIDLQLNGTLAQCIQIRILNQSGTIVIREIKVNATLT